MLAAINQRVVQVFVHDAQTTVRTNTATEAVDLITVTKNTKTCWMGKYLTLRYEVPKVDRLFIVESHLSLHQARTIAHELLKAAAELEDPFVPECDAGQEAGEEG